MNQSVRIDVQGNLALIEIFNPPVNALSHEVRAGLQACVNQALANDAVLAIVIYGSGKTFIAGADIREFGQPLKHPFLPDLINEIEAAHKPVIAALHGVALGGGLEAALGAHYRIALASAKFGLPEVALGLLPGAGGTQRVPRLIAVADAIQLITSGKKIDAEAALGLGLIDRVADW